jgi:hypothetical protein
MGKVPESQVLKIAEALKMSQIEKQWFLYLQSRPNQAKIKQGSREEVFKKKKKTCELASCVWLCLGE